MSNACLLIWASKYWTRHLCKRRRTSSLATQLNLELLSSCSICAAQQTGHHESGTASLWGSAFSMPMWRCPGASLQSTRTSLYSIQSKPSQATHLLLRIRLLQRDQETELQSTARTASKNISESQNSYNFMTNFFWGISPINIYHYLLIILLPIGSMGIVDLPTFTIKIHQM